MRLDELHHDAEELRRHATPVESPFQVDHLDQALVDGGVTDLDELNNPASTAAHGHAEAWLGDTYTARGPRAAEHDVQRNAQGDLLTEDPAAPGTDVEVDGPLPLPPPPTGEQRRRWWEVRLPARAAKPASAAAAAPTAASGDTDTPTRRQRNPAPWLAVVLLGMVMVALLVGLLNHQRVDTEATRTLEAKRAAAERAVGLLGGQPAGNAPPPVDLPSVSAAAAAPDPLPPLPSDGRDRHEAMLTAIKKGAVLAALPPTALAQPSPLPADLPPLPAVAVGAGGARASFAAVPTPQLPPKKVSLTVEGTTVPPAAAARVNDPLAGSRVSGALKGAPAPQHRVYQLRETDGEWLGYVAPSDADPLAAGVWAGSGDLLAGGWRVAEVTPQRLTLVGPNGALEILRP